MQDPLHTACGAYSAYLSADPLHDLLEDTSGQFRIYRRGAKSDIERLSPNFDHRYIPGHSFRDGRGDRMAGIHASCTYGKKQTEESSDYNEPVLVLLAGLLVLANPFAAASVPFLILGVSSIVYGVSELINQLRFRKREETPVIEDAEIVEVTPIEE